MLFRHHGDTSREKMKIKNQRHTPAVHVTVRPDELMSAPSAVITPDKGAPPENAMSVVRNREYDQR